MGELRHMYMYIVHKYVCMYIYLYDVSLPLKSFNKTTVGWMVACTTTAIVATYCLDVSRTQLQ